MAIKIEPGFSNQPNGFTNHGLYFVVFRFESRFQVFQPTRSCENLAIASSSRLKSRDSEMCSGLLMIFTARRESRFVPWATHLSNRTWPNPPRPRIRSCVQCSSREDRPPTLSIWMYEWTVMESRNCVRSLESSTRSGSRDMILIWTSLGLFTNLSPAGDQPCRNSSQIFIDRVLFSCSTENG
jgi:hypothetical protein